MMNLSGLVNLYNSGGLTTSKTAMPTTVAPVASDNTANPSVTTTVSLSEQGKLAATQNAQPSFAELGLLARDKLDALKQQASEKTGIPLSQLNIQQAGLMDYSSFSDQELAAMALNPARNFTEDERTNAEGELAQRMKVSIESFSGPFFTPGDLRGQWMAINSLYHKISPEVRQALGWDSAMLAMNNKLLAGAEQEYGPLEASGLWLALLRVQSEGGLSLTDDQTTSRLASPLP